MERKSCWRMKQDGDRPYSAYLCVVHFALSSIIFAPCKNLLQYLNMVIAFIATVQNREIKLPKFFG